MNKKGAQVEAKPIQIMNSSVKRAAGFFIAFIGLFLVTERSGITSALSTITAIFLVLGGLFLTSTYLKRLGKREERTHAWAWVFIGLLMIVVGGIILIKGGFVNRWFVIALGSLIALFGLICLISALVSKGKAFALNVTLAVITIVIGVLIALLSINKIGQFKSGILYIIFGSIAATIGVIDIIIY